MVIQKSKALRISILLSLVLILVLWPNESEEQQILPEATTVIHAPIQPVKKPLDPVPAVDIVLKKIAWCESQNRQFNPDGSVFRGKINPQDTGKYQINEHYHLEDSKKLGMDIYTLAGNTAYAKYLYRTQGTTPWDWSKHCWADPDRVWWEENGNYWSTNTHK